VRRGIAALAQPRPKARWTTVDLSDHVQIVVADPSERSQGRNFGVLSQQTCSVGDLATKHALILAGAGWGNLPLWMVEADLAAGRLARMALSVRRSSAPDRMPLYIIRRVHRAFGPAASGLCHMMTDDFRAVAQAGE
jgi:DNA-binding transcriptional LysR family regulator